MSLWSRPTAKRVSLAERLPIGGVVLAALAFACTNRVPNAAPARVAEVAAPTVEPPPTADAAPNTNTNTSTSTSTSTSGDAGSDAPSRDAPVRVKVVTIGMHVGGGPYDEPTKEPIKRSVEPHFAELARCWKHVTKPHQTDVGVDLVIEAAGGRARVSNPRGVAEGEGFAPCVVAFFENIDFEKPKNGKTVISYSVRFTP